jgi:hypothetical protein
VGTPTKVVQIEFDPLDQNVCYLSNDGDHNLYISRNGNLSEFEKRDLGIPSIYRIAIAVLSSKLYLMLTHVSGATSVPYTGVEYANQMVISNNKGISFDPAIDVREMDGVNPVEITMKINYKLAFAVNPNDTNELYLGGVHLRYLESGGTIWKAPRWEGHIDVHSIVFQPETNNLFVGQMGGYINCQNLLVPPKQRLQ